MRWNFSLVGLLAAGAQAFAPVPILWGGSPAEKFVLAPAASSKGAMQDPQQLKIWDLHARTSPEDVPHFVVKPDKTIKWESTGFCVEAVGDAVGVGHCNGSPTQSWNVLPFGTGRASQIQLTGSDKCIDIDTREGGLNGASAVLRECDREETESWMIERRPGELILAPTEGPLQHLEPLFFMRHGLIPSVLVVMLGTLSLSAWLWQLHRRVRAVAERGGNIKLNQDLGGVVLPAGVAPCDPHLVNALEMAPALMAISPIPAEGTDARNDEIKDVATNTRRDIITAGLSIPVLLSQPAECFAARPDRSTTLNALQQQERTLEDLFRAATPSVVSIDVSRESMDVMSTMSPVEVPKGRSSGFIWDTEGHIVTNYHVVKGADKAVVKVTPEYGLASLDYTAKLVGIDADNDIAVLKIDVMTSQLRPASLGSSSNLQVGATAIAIGNPFGLDHSLTLGVISGLDREAKAPSGRMVQNVIQTDAAINPGNSGGVLLDSSGKVVGMNSSILTPSGASAGVGLAVPVDTLKRQVAAIIQDGVVVRPGLGIKVLPPGKGGAVGVNEGLLVLKVVPGSAAAAAGLQGTSSSAEGNLILGDVILKLGGTTINSEDDLTKALDSYTPGQKATLTIARLAEVKGEQKEIKKKITIQLDSLRL